MLLGLLYGLRDVGRCNALSLADNIAVATGIEEMPQSEMGRMLLQVQKLGR